MNGLDVLLFNFFSTLEYNLIKSKKINSYASIVDK